MKTILILILAVLAVGCKKETQCHDGCYVVVTTTKVDTFRNNVCATWSAIEDGKSTDAAGNPITTSNAHLVCP